MAKYDVKFSCGHEAVINLLGKGEERRRKIAYYEQRGICPTCRKAQIDAENAKGCTAVTMPYKEYKQSFADCKTKQDSYDRETKNIIVFVPNTKTEQER